jgi:hypothetical protein
MYVFIYLFACLYSFSGPITELHLTTLSGSSGYTASNGARIRKYRIGLKQKFSRLNTQTFSSIV